jgi:DTW domain-containing protein YfiP
MGPAALPELEAPDRQAVVLFPSPGAVCLSTLVDGPPVTLVVPDGNWRQATRAVRRSPGMAALPRVTLPEGPPSRYRLRSHPDPQRISTFEAVARALGILEPDGPALQAHLEAAFDRFVERSLFTRGQLAPQDVTGGIPARWNVWPPVDSDVPEGL